MVRIGSARMATNRFDSGWIDLDRNGSRRIESDRVGSAHGSTLGIGILSRVSSDTFENLRVLSSILEYVPDIFGDLRKKSEKLSKISMMVHVLLRRGSNCLSFCLKCGHVYIVIVYTYTRTYINTFNLQSYRLESERFRFFYTKYKICLKPKWNYPL